MDNFINSLAGKHVVLSGCGGGSDVLGSSVIYAQIKETARKARSMAVRGSRWLFPKGRGSQVWFASCFWKK